MKKKNYTLSDLFITALLVGAAIQLIVMFIL